MCCNCKERLLIIFMATWTLIQSMGYAALAILGILVYECEIDMESDKFSYLWYLIYFRRGVCGVVNWSLLGLNIPNSVQPIWPEVTDVAYRANIMVIIFLALSLAWMITSIGLIFAACTSCIGRCFYFSTLVSWSFIGILIILADCAGLGIFLYDLIHVTTFADMLDFLEISNAQDIITLAGDFWAPFYLPSLLMMIVAARGFLFWAFNIAIIILVIRSGSRIGKRIPKSVDNPQRPKPYEYGRENNQMSPYTTQQNDSNQGMHPMRVTTQYNNALPYGLVQQQSPNNNNGYNQNQNNSNNEHIPRIVPAAAMQSPQSRKDPNNYSEYGAYDNPIYPQKVTPQSDNSSQNSSLNPHSSDIGWMSPSSKQNKIPPKTAPKPILKVKKSPVDEISTDNSSDRSDRNSLQVPPEELRSQLPWSYTVNPEELTKPRRNFVALRDDEDLPPVPVPDYTLHFPKNKRSGIDSK